MLDLGHSEMLWYGMAHTHRKRERERECVWALDRTGNGAVPTALSLSGDERPLVLLCIPRTYLYLDGNNHQFN